MTIEVLASGLIGALLVFFFGLLREWWRTRARLMSHWEALLSEIEKCAGDAAEFLNAGVAAPLYRLPTVCYVNSFPALLSDGALTGSDARALQNFYTDVETLNRGLDIADEMFRSGNTNRLAQVNNRNLLKAPPIATPSGTNLVAALNVVDRNLVRLRSGA